ncbi:MAG: hypothetical protein HY730_02245 [Candidatus Tectomicrobia bacterium]|uniref:Uncharacterized protein n=1 Tax=Tectimicrobiota bacterium TaxID=2528274 RepID=A0A933GLY3_UNCTE|nr:hypothetical protein [Candidatus Tectomicrobia bacterium]
MGILTEDMTRLRGEIEALRTARKNLMQELAHGVQARRNELFETRARFFQEHGEMVRNTRENLLGFMSDIRKIVAEVQSQASVKRALFRTEIVNSHKAWYGPDFAAQRANEPEEAEAVHKPNEEACKREKEESIVTEGTAINTGPNEYEEMKETRAFQMPENEEDFIKPKTKVKKKENTFIIQEEKQEMTNEELFGDQQE